MMKKYKKYRGLALVLSLVLLAGCSPAPADAPSPTPTASTAVSPTPSVSAAVSPTPADSPSPTPSASEEVPPAVSDTPAPEAGIKLKPYDDVYALYESNTPVVKEGEYAPDDIYTYSFYSGSVFEGAEDIAAKVLEEGKNPGLGVRDLHAQGITGEGVNVAIIDQPLALPGHEEFADRIAAYYDSGCEVSEQQGSMHGPAVLSLLAGESMGVAPGAKVYFAAAPSWKADSAYYADCLFWIIRQNRELPEGEKIRVVSVSAAPEEGWFENAAKWDKAVAAAENAGIMVLDCRSAADTGFIFSSYYDRSDPENVEKCIPGYPDKVFDDFSNEFYSDTIFAPASYRTFAQELQGVEAGEPCYRYDGTGGESWAVPYVAGVLALGWQVAPNLDAETMKDLLFQSCWINAMGNHMINPTAFIELVREAA